MAWSRKELIMRSSKSQNCGITEWPDTAPHPPHTRRTKIQPPRIIATDYRHVPRDFEDE